MAFKGFVDVVEEVSSRRGERSRTEERAMVLEEFKKIKKKWPHLCNAHLSFDIGHGHPEYH